MARKLQLGALILGMLLVGVERLTATASAAAREGSISSPVYDGLPIPKPDMVR